MRSTSNAKTASDRPGVTSSRKADGGWAWLKGASAGRGLEQLEQRLVLAGTPLPSIADLERPENSVVRFETTYGDIDIELFDSQAPITVANFLIYTTSGRFDETFFHRTVQDFVVQGGGFTFEDGVGIRQYDLEAAIIREQTGRSNVARTIAMARTNELNSATNQFFFNTLDNDGSRGTTNLDTSTGGYTVFGRVIQGWNNVLTIAGLTRQNLSNNASFAGSMFAGAMGEVPVNSGYSPGAPIVEGNLVYIKNAEVIKPRGATGFYTQTVSFPEGFRSPFSVETIRMVNSNNATATYQIVAHYESGKRDEVIDSGTIAARSSLEIVVSDFAQASLNLVRAETPYSLQVMTSVPTTVTDPAPIAVSSHRRDFGGVVGDSFYNSAGLTNLVSQQWDFPRIERNSLSREFITWMSTWDQTTTVRATFYATGSLPRTFTFTLEPYRRGGVEIGQLGLPNGIISAHITADFPIVAALSDWDLPGPGVAAADAYTPAFGGLGINGGGASTAALPNAEILGGFTNVISFLNPNPTVGVVTLSIYRTDRMPGETPIQRTVIVLSNSRTDFALTTANLGIPAGERFSITYSNNASIAAAYASIDETSRHVAGSRADGVLTNFTSITNSTAHFADGFLDPSLDETVQQETVSIFNPFASSGSVFSYDVRALFADGTEVEIAAGTLTTRGRVDIRVDSNAAMRAKAGAAANFRHYAIVITGNATGTSQGTLGNAGIVELIRRDTSAARSIGSGAIYSGSTLLFLNNAVFLPGGSGS